MQFSKKASLNLSINAIVILILAITMLGLGLGFMKGMFGKVTGELGEMTEGLAAERKAELESSLDRISFHTTELEIKRGTKDNIYYAVRNNLEATDEFRVDGFVCTDAIDPDAADSLDDISFQALGLKTIVPGESVALPLIIQVKAGAVPTIYSCDIIIPHPVEDATYAKKNMYITVTP